MSNKELLRGSQTTRQSSIKRDSSNGHGTSSNSIRPSSSSSLREHSTAYQQQQNHYSNNTNTNQSPKRTQKTQPSKGPSNPSQKESLAATQSSAHKHRASSSHIQSGNYRPLSNSTTKSRMTKSSAITDETAFAQHKMFAIQDTYYTQQRREQDPKHQAKLIESKSRISLIAKLIADKNADSSPQLTLSHTILENYTPLTSPRSSSKQKPSSTVTTTTTTTTNTITPGTVSHITSQVNLSSTYTKQQQQQQQLLHQQHQQSQQLLQQYTPRTNSSHTNNSSKIDEINVNLILEKYKKFIEKKSQTQLNNPNDFFSNSKNHPLQKQIITPTAAAQLNAQKSNTYLSSPSFSKQSTEPFLGMLQQKKSPSISTHFTKESGIFKTQATSPTRNTQPDSKIALNRGKTKTIHQIETEAGSKTARFSDAAYINIYRVPSQHAKNNLRSREKLPEKNIKFHQKSEGESSPPPGASKASTYFESILSKPRGSINQPTGQQQQISGGSDIESASTDRVQNTEEIRFLNELNAPNSTPSIDDFTYLQVLGHGSYAIVRSAMHKKTQFIVAIKSYDKSKLVDLQKKQNVEREVKILMNLSHKYIIKLYKVIESEDHVNLIMEYSPCQALNTYLKQKYSKKLSDNEARYIFRQLLEAVKYLHRKRVIHRDIKLENILIDSDRQIKLIDFGFSIVVPQSNQLKMFCGTPSYMAPEIIGKDGYSFPADIWALGILLHKILSGSFPFQGQSNKSLYQNIVKGKTEMQPAPITSTSAKNLIKQMLQEQPEQRPSLEEILKNEWMVYS